MNRKPSRAIRPAANRRVHAKHGRSSGDLIHISEVIEEFLDSLEREALAQVELDGPLRGPVKPTQRSWSHTLDLIASEREIGTR